MICEYCNKPETRDASLRRFLESIYFESLPMCDHHAEEEVYAYNKRQGFFRGDE